jgi:5-methylcytosine-specific restriction endonuclease McrA
MSMDESVRHLVRARARNRCEYCRLPQHEGIGYRFHIEHIRARQHGGNDEPDNLALSCTNCNWNKGTNLSTVDSVTNAVVPLFHPRVDSWAEHFKYVNLRIVGLTAVGRATARLLRMNSADRIEVRRQMFLRGKLTELD